MSVCLTVHPSPVLVENIDFMIPKCGSVMEISLNEA